MKPKKILIFNPFGIGDVLFTTPLVRNLRDHFKNTSLAYICSLRAHPAVSGNIFLDNVFIFEKDEWKSIAAKSKVGFVKKAFSFFNLIKKEKFDVVFDLSMNTQYGFFLKCCGIKTRIGYNFKKRGRFLTHKIDIPGGFSGKHVARYYLDLLKLLCVAPKDHKFDLFLSGQEREKGKSIMKEHGLRKDDFLIGICPGSGDSWGKSAYFKRWPLSYFSQLCEKLSRNLKAKIIFFGSPAEKYLCGHIADRISAKTVNLCGKIGLKEFCAVTENLRLLVTNDGGPFHIAQATGTPAVAFFGPVDETTYGIYPENDNYIALSKKLNCRPCYEKFKFRECAIDKKCLRSIGVDEAYAAAKKLV